jgi:hypothetical protein
MHRAFIDFAAVRICNRRTQHDGSQRRKRKRHNDEQRQKIPKPRKLLRVLLFMFATSNHRVGVEIFGANRRGGHSTS